MTIVGRLAALCVAMTCALPAHALEIVRRGDAIVLSGQINPGDDFRFRDEVIAKGAPRSVILDSTGGHVLSAYEIGRLVRSKGMKTIVDAGQMRCVSACTLIFAAGVQRHYVNANFADQAVAPADGRGLGYHEGLSFVAGRWQQAGSATAYMIEGYYEFGSSKAASLITRASVRQMYYVSGTSALSLGLATSLTLP